MWDVCYIWRSGDIFQQSLSHSPAISFMGECVNLRCNLCQSSKQSGTQKKWTLSALQEITNMENFLHICILNIMFQMWLHATQYCDIVSRNCCVYSFVCNIIGWLFIARGCDTKIIWMKRYLKIVFTFSSHFLWSNVKTVHIVTKQCS